MRNFFAGIVVIALLAMFAIQNGGISVGASSSPVALPPIQRTAIYAPAVATQQAGGSLADVSMAQAAADEREAARVYAQSVQAENEKRRAWATEQASLATQTANDMIVSKEYATLAAVSLQATAQAISNTISVDREMYAARQTEIQATRQAVSAKAVEAELNVTAQKDTDTFWSTFLRIIAITFVSLLALAAWKLIGRIQPRIEYEEIEVPTKTQLQQPSDPPVSVTAGLNFSALDDRQRLLDILTFSGRQYGWTQNRIAGKNDIPALSGRMWEKAIDWARKSGYDIVTQQGDPKYGGGTYVPGEIGSLKTLHDRIRLDDAVNSIPTTSPTP